MKNWSTAAWIKSVLIALAAIANLFLPISPDIPGKNTFYVFGIVALIFGAFSTPLSCYLNQKFQNYEIVKPTWNDSLKLKRPLSFYLFMTYFMGIIGLAIILNGLIYFQQFSPMGFMIIGFGSGLRIGVELSLKWLKRDDQS